MKPLQKGYTLVEMMMAVLLLSLAVNGVMISRKKLQKAELESKVNEIVSGIEYMKHSAVVTGIEHSIFCYEDRILFKKMSQATVYKVSLGKGISVDKGCAYKYLLRFSGTMAPSGAATLILKDVNLKQKVRITVGVATGKIRVYYETL